MKKLNQLVFLSRASCQGSFTKLSLVPELFSLVAWLALSSRDIFTWQNCDLIIKMIHQYSDYSKGIQLYSFTSLLVAEVLYHLQKIAHELNAPPKWGLFLLNSAIFNRSWMGHLFIAVWWYFKDRKSQDSNPHILFQIIPANNIVQFIFCQKNNNRDITSSLVDKKPRVYCLGCWVFSQHPSFSLV